MKIRIRRSTARNIIVLADGCRTKVLARAVKDDDMRVTMAKITAINSAVRRTFSINTLFHLVLCCLLLPS